MKRSFLLAICLSAAAAFAGAYDIDEFTAQDVGTPDDYITAEFGGELKVAPAEEVESLQEGRLVVRQKFVDPFGEAETTYQLYQGAKGDMDGLTPLAVPEGTSYSDVVKTKIYQRRGMPAEEDFEKVYFDGKNVYIPNKSSAIVFVAGSAVELKPAAPVPEAEEEAAPEEEEAPAAPAVASSAGEECDEYDPDCEDEDEDEYDVAGNMDKSNRDADERDNAASYAADDASENATDRFGIADEVRFWSAVALSALAATSAVLGVLEHMDANKAGDAYDELDEVHDELKAKIDAACAANAATDAGACAAAMSYYDLTIGSGYSLKTLEARMDVNKKTRDSHATARNIWFGVTGVSLTAAIVLFVW
jgi:hypothetical protein